MSLKRSLLFLFVLAAVMTGIAIPAQGTSLSTDYYEFTHAATYYFDVTFFGHSVYFPSWTQEHVWERHVLGYERDYKSKTTFYPLGQYVGGRKLPETMDGYDMVYLIEETIEYGRVYFEGSDAIITYYLPYYQYREYGISEMKVVLEKEYYHGDVYYEVVTAYPVYGPDVAVYEDHHWIN